MDPSIHDDPLFIQTRDRIAELEAEIVIHGNAARGAMLEQGALFERFAGNKTMIELLCEETGVAYKTAKHRGTVAQRLYNHPQSVEIKALLAEHTDISVSFDSLAALLGDEDPLTLLGMLIHEARAGNKGRVTRDAVRRARGNVSGTVGTVEATRDRMLRDPEYLRALLTNPELAALMDSDPEIQKALALAYNQSEATKRHRRAQARAQREAAAATSEDGPRVLSPSDALTALWAIDQFLELAVQVEDSDSKRIIALFMDGLQARAKFALAIEAGDHVAPTEDEMDRELEALLEGGA